MSVLDGQPMLWINIHCSLHWILLFEKTDNCQK